MAGGRRAGQGVTAVDGAGRATLGTTIWSRCHRAARDEGLAAAIDVLCSELLPGLVPCGPAGHSVLPAGVALGGRVWLDGVTFGAAAGRMRLLAAFDLPGGPLEAVRWTGPAADPAAGPNDYVRAEWVLGLVWLRLGWSEGLRGHCLRYLRGRRTGDSTLLQQQLVKGSLADVTAEQLEIRAMLLGCEADRLTPQFADELHDRITVADRAQLRLLGASSMLLGGPGEEAYVSELIADAWRSG
ncbi:DUF2786 domain-containing protein [Actinocrispum sp. NPDC049592]|uniref:DUF2786 domain-containing protein n=1 Tax=Actinocrispum sp. NPDC049592 TaxID=3154835 RepID=UPI003440069C